MYDVSLCIVSSLKFSCALEQKLDFWRWKVNSLLPVTTTTYQCFGIPQINFHLTSYPVKPQNQAHSQSTQTHTHDNITERMHYAYLLHILHDHGILFIHSFRFKFSFFIFSLYHGLRTMDKVQLYRNIEYWNRKTFQIQFSLCTRYADWIIQIRVVSPFFSSTSSSLLLLLLFCLLFLFLLVVVFF